MSNTQIFGKKGKLSSEEKILAYFFLYLTNLKGEIVGLQKVFRHILWMFLNHFLGTKRWIETNN